MFLAWISLIVSTLGGAPYAVLALRGKIKPERTTWGIWTLILVLSLAGYRAEGGNESSLFIVGDLIITGFIFIISIFRGTGGTSKLDSICVLLSLIGLAVWQISADPIFQILGTVTADMLAAIPTVKNTLSNPESESPIAFLSSSIAALLGVISIGHWNLALIMYPIYLYSINLAIAVTVMSSQYITRRGDSK